MNFNRSCSLNCFDIFTMTFFVFALAVYISNFDQQQKRNMRNCLVTSFHRNILFRFGLQGRRFRLYLFPHLYLWKIHKKKIAKSSAQMHFRCRVVGIDSAIHEKMDQTPQQQLNIIWIFDLSKEWGKCTLETITVPCIS